MKSKSFIEQMEDRKSEILEVKSAIEEEILKAEQRISELDGLKADAVKNHNMKAYSDFCMEQNTLREYVESNQKYSDDLTYKYHWNDMAAHWSEEVNEYQAASKVIESRIRDVVIKQMIPIYQDACKANRAIQSKQQTYISFLLDGEPSYNLSSPSSVRNISGIRVLQDLFDVFDCKTLANKE